MVSLHTHGMKIGNGEYTDACCIGGVSDRSVLLEQIDGLHSLEWQKREREKDSIFIVVDKSLKEVYMCLDPGSVLHRQTVNKTFQSIRDWVPNNCLDDCADNCSFVGDNCVFSLILRCDRCGSRVPRSSWRNWIVRYLDPCWGDWNFPRGECCIRCRGVGQNVLRCRLVQSWRGRRQVEHL